MKAGSYNSLISRIPFVKQTMSMKLVAFILGAGTHIGSAVAAQLRGKGYWIALGSRNPKPTSEDDAHFNVKVDVQKRASNRLLTPSYTS